MSAVVALLPPHATRVPAPTAARNIDLKRFMFVLQISGGPPRPGGSAFGLIEPRRRRGVAGERQAPGIQVENRAARRRGGPKPDSVRGACSRRMVFVRLAVNGGNPFTGVAPPAG